MRIAIRDLALALGIAALSSGLEPARASDPRTVSGAVEFVSEDAVEVAGQRGVVAESTDVRSDGRSISLASVRRGMAATMELDDAGRILELRVSGVVE